jgi:outer membrane protein OmpA-like peptidoglycan-associated protein
MNRKSAKNGIHLVVILFSLGMIFGCAGREYNTKQSSYPYIFIHKEIQDADRAVESARRAGKDTQCPLEFKVAEDLKNKAYDVYTACRTQEGIALAREATKTANTLCLARPAAEALSLPKAVLPVIIMVSEPKVDEKVLVARTEPKIIVLAFEDIHFDFDQSSLTPEAQRILKKNLLILQDNPKAKVRIAGYTSASGTEKYNQKLSERRARAVKEYLIAEGVVAPYRLYKTGFGESHPEQYEVAPKDLYSKAAKANMRVLFEIIVEQEYEVRNTPDTPAAVNEHR